MNSLILIAFLASQIQLSLSSAASQQVSLHLCGRNKTVSVEIRAKLKKNSASCQCQATASRSGHGPLRDDYVHTPGLGFHKLHAEAKTWNDARHVCEDEGGHLAIINSKAEEEAMLSLYRRNSSSITDAFNAEEAFLGIHDLYKEGEWVTIFGQSLEAIGYARWSNGMWGQQPDNKHNNQHCGALLFNGGMDDVHCYEKFAFFCELPISCAD